MRPAQQTAQADADVQARAVGPCSAVSVIITCFNHGCWLADAITSVLEQSYGPIELIVVDDGSTDDTAAVCDRFPEVEYVYQPNAGLAAARNTGLGVAAGRYVCWLDADDRLLPNAIATGVAALSKRPDWAFAFGGYRVITATGKFVQTIDAAPGELPYHALLKLNRVRMHATVLYRRSALDEAGTFDTTLPASEDYDMILRIARRHPVGSHGIVVAEYRQHDANMSRDAERMLTSSLAVLEVQANRIRTPQEQQALDVGLDSMKRYYGAQLVRQALVDLPRPSRTASAFRRLGVARRSAPQAFFASLTGGPRSVLRIFYRALPGPLAKWAHAARERARGRPPVGGVLFGDLRRLQPIDPDFGFGRGFPIDRHYIEAFLGRHADDIKGRVLEVGDNTYTRRFGRNRVKRSDVVDIHADSPAVTIVADLADAPQIPDAAFDCIILTQTLQYIFDVPAAVTTVRRALKPGGTLLLTVPGLGQVDHDERRESWYWLITEPAVRRLLGKGWSEVTVGTFGNVLSSVGFLHGLAVGDLKEDELASRDPTYQLIVYARAVKPIREV